MRASGRVSRRHFSSPIPEDSILYNDYRRAHPDSHQGSHQGSHQDSKEDSREELALVPHDSSAVAPRAISLFIQMEYCSDGSLRDVLNEGSVPLSVRIDFFRQVGLARGAEA